MYKKIFCLLASSLMSGSLYASETNISEIISKEHGIKIEKHRNSSESQNDSITTIEYVTEINHPDGLKLICETTKTKSTTIQTVSCRGGKYNQYKICKPILEKFEAYLKENPNHDNN